MHEGALAEDVADRLPQRLGAVDHEQDALLGVQAAVDEVGQQRGGDGGVLGRALPEPERDLDALGGDPERDDVACGPCSSIPSSIITARRTSSRRRLISASRFSRVRATNSRLTADFDVDRAWRLDLAADRLAACARTGASRRRRASARSTSRVSGSRSAKCP